MLTPYYRFPSLVVSHHFTSYAALRLSYFNPGMETLAHRTPRHIVDDPGEDINPWSDDIWMDAHLPGWPPNAHCTMTDLLQPHILLQDNAHDPPQHYLHLLHSSQSAPLANSLSHPLTLCHISPSYRLSFFPSSSRPFYSLSYIMHFSDWVIHHSYIYQSTLLNKCCCIIFLLLPSCIPERFLRLRGNCATSLAI